MKDKEIPLILKIKWMSKEEATSFLPENATHYLNKILLEQPYAYVSPTGEREVHYKVPEEKEKQNER